MPGAVCYEGGGPASLQLQGRDQLTCNELMSKDYTAPDGTPFEWAAQSFDCPYLLFWYERQQHFVIVNPPWWKFWAKSETLQESRWVRKKQPISQDLGDYLQGGKSRVVEIVNSISTDKATGIWGVQLESGMQSVADSSRTNLIATSSQADVTNPLEMD